MISTGLVGQPANTALDMNIPLHPFTKPGTPSSHYTSNDMTDIHNQLGYSYGHGSLDSLHADRPDTALISNFKRVHNINRAQILGSFVIRLYAKGPDMSEEVEIGRNAILNHWSVEGCANCQNKLEAESLVPVDDTMLRFLKGSGENASIQYRVELQTHLDSASKDGDLPKVEDL